MTLPAPITNEATALHCNALAALTAAELDTAVRQSVETLHALSRKGQAEMRERLMPALLEVKRRYRAGDWEEFGFPYFYDYLESIGINPNTFRTWEAREMSSKLHSLWGKAKHEAEQFLIHDAGCDCDDCHPEAEPAAPLPDDGKDISVEVVAELPDTPATKQKPEPAKETWIAGPPLGHISRLGADHALEKGDEGNFYYLVSTRDFSFYVEADKIDVVRKDMAGRFGKDNVEVKREGSVQADLARGYSNAHSSLHGLQRDLSRTIREAEHLQTTLEEFRTLPETLRESASTIGFIETTELEASLTKVKTIVAALKTVSLSGIEIPTLKPAEA